MVNNNDLKKLLIVQSLYSSDGTAHSMNYEEIIACVFDNDSTKINEVVKKAIKLKLITSNKETYD